jgi:hypothetical protein
MHNEDPAFLLQADYLIRLYCGPQSTYKSTSGRVLPLIGIGTRLRVRGWGSPSSDDWRKSLALCPLCAVDHRPITFFSDFTETIHSQINILHHWRHIFNDLRR